METLKEISDNYSKLENIDDNKKSYNNVKHFDKNMGEGKTDLHTDYTTIFLKCNRIFLPQLSVFDRKGQILNYSS